MSEKKRPSSKPKSPTPSPTPAPAASIAKKAAEPQAAPEKPAAEKKAAKPKVEKAAPVKAAAPKAAQPAATPKAAQPAATPKAAKAAPVAKAAAAPKAPAVPKAPAPPKAAKPAAAAKPKAPAKAKAQPAVSGGLSIVMVAGDAGGRIGALPRALARLGHQVTVISPRPQGAPLGDGDQQSVGLQFGDRAQDVTLHTLPADQGVTAVFVDAPGDPADEAWRFGVFGRAALEYARQRGTRPSVFHLHDWQAGMVPVFQKMQFSSDPVVGGVPVVFTIHQLDQQGLFPSATLPQLGLGWEVFDVQALEYWGQISYLKGGINFSERITAAGDTSRMLTPEHGQGFHGVLSRRADDLAEVLHGDQAGSDAAWDALARDYVKVYEAAGA